VIDTGAFFSELQKIAEERVEQGDAPTFWEHVRYGVLEPTARIGVPVGLGVGLGYGGAGAAHHALSQAPGVSDLWRGLSPTQQVGVARALRVLGVTGGALGGLALGYNRMRAYQEIEEDRKRRREESA